MIPGFLIIYLVMSLISFKNRWHSGMILIKSVIMKILTILLVMMSVALGYMLQPSLIPVKGKDSNTGDGEEITENGEGGDADKSKTAPKPKEVAKKIGDKQKEEASGSAEVKELPKTVNIINTVSGVSLGEEQVTFDAGKEIEPTKLEGDTLHFLYLGTAGQIAVSKTNLDEKQKEMMDRKAIAEVKVADTQPDEIPEVVAEDPEPVVVDGSSFSIDEPKPDDTTDVSIPLDEEEEFIDPFSGVNAKETDPFDVKPEKKKETIPSNAVPLKTSSVESHSEAELKKILKESLLDTKITELEKVKSIGEGEIAMFDGEEYFSSVIEYESDTIFGLKIVQVRAIIERGTVKTWVNPKTDQAIL